MESDQLGFCFRTSKQAGISFEHEFALSGKQRIWMGANEAGRTGMGIAFDTFRWRVVSDAKKRQRLQRDEWLGHFGRGFQSMKVCFALGLPWWLGDLSTSKPPNKPAIRGKLRL